MDVRLNPNSVYFDRGQVRIRTLLGSCVAVTFWHPAKHFGFMCHFSEPSSTRIGSRPNTMDKLDPRFGDDSLQLFLRMATAVHTRPRDYVVKVFGGGNMFHDKTRVHQKRNSARMGEQNAEQAFRLLLAHGLEIEVADVGEFGYRDIIFDLSDGSVLVKLSGRSVRAKQVTRSLGEQFKI
ncbi:hypothetical protein [Marinobacter sediminum]|uniref:hypothetical protein n=1 Tax=Marinobacter sediminum TaxID=256323 RepID=UPI001939EE69|nr:hypothetical protein [Marinobacter sediminum]